MKALWWLLHSVPDKLLLPSREKCRRTQSKPQLPRFTRLLHPHLILLRPSPEKPRRTESEPQLPQFTRLLHPHLMVLSRRYQKICIRLEDGVQ
jgi:hypothetical protein